MLSSEAQRRDVMDKISVTEAEGRAYYDTHKQEFTTPSEVTLREILIDVPVSDRGVNVAEDDAAKAEAEAVHKRLVAGEPFPRLAAEHSDAASKANGGLIGPVKRDELAEALQARMDAMKVGELTDVIRTQRGYQILKLESSTPLETMPFEQAREQISDRVFTDKRRVEFDKYLDKLRAEAIIDWKNPELKKAYEIGLERLKAGVAAQPAAQ